ncbi:hypothetical protein V6N13_050916 [Hibiscus sabdariffa]
MTGALEESDGFSMSDLENSLEESNGIFLYELEEFNGISIYDLEESSREFENNNYGMVGATESSVKNMVNKVKVEDGEEGDCVVCLEELRVGFEASQMPCAHIFHADCIQRWLNQSHYCPICRSPELVFIVNPMKHVLKLLSLLVVISALWIGLLQASIIPQSHTWLLPIYFIVSLGCYGLLMVGVGLMRFPTCPQEALLLQP